MIAITKNNYRINSEHLFMISALLVNGGNYIYNLLLGRILGPEKFADAAIMITFLLVFSFVAMTFQLVTAKFSVIFEQKILKSFIYKMNRIAVISGVVLGIAIVYYSKDLQLFFKTTTSNMFVIFGVGVPLYFLMSINRGFFQGKKKFGALAVTYQLEMISRLVFTLILLYFLEIDSSILIAIGIFCSFLFGLIPFKIQKIKPIKEIKLSVSQRKMIRSFFLITVFYELTQIIINNSDILLVKHYFETYDAGLYASLALIGRVVYFVTWMFVMLLLPKVVQLKKEGKPTRSILLKNVGYISLLIVVLVAVCSLFPKEVVLILFGKDYIAIAPLLWKYALATGVFAISNVFAYYYLSLDKYIPVVASGIFGLLQIIFIVLYHSTLGQVVNMQILAMTLLLSLQLSYFLLGDTKKPTTSKH